MNYYISSLPELSFHLRRKISPCLIGQSFEDDTKAPVCNSYLFYLRPSFTSKKSVVGRVAWPDDRLSGRLSLQVISHFKF